MIFCARATRGLRRVGGGTVRPSFLLGEAARSECAPSMRAVQNSLTAPPRGKVGKIGRPSPGQMARLGVPVGGRVRKMRPVEDQSAPIPREKRTILEGVFEKERI